MRQDPCWCAGRRAAVVCIALALACSAACTSSPEGPTPNFPSNTSSTPTTTSPTPTPTPTPTPPSGSLTYTHDIQPILSASCVLCHNAARANAGVDLSSYAGVMRVVTPGSANSLLILVTQPGGLMYPELVGNASQEAQTIQNWIVNDNAAQ